MPAEQRVTIVTVAYNSVTPIADMLKSIPRDVPVVIVDNASADVDALILLVAEYPQVTLITAEQNLGFGAACNLGAGKAKTEFLLFLNPDTRLYPQTLTLLEEAADTYPEASAFNPKLVDDDGRVRFKRKCHLLPRSQWMPRGMPDTPFETCVLVGAAIFVRRQAFEAIDGFDPEIFLYFEDDDLSVRLAKTCGPLMIVPDAALMHTRGGSSGAEDVMSPFKSWHFAFARVLTTRKHGRPFARMKALITAFRKLLNPVMLTSQAERASRVAYVKGTWAAVVSSTNKRTPES